MTVPPRTRRIGAALRLGFLTMCVLVLLAALVRCRAGWLLRLDNSLVNDALAISRPRAGLRRLLLEWQYWAQPFRVHLVATCVCLWLAVRLRRPRIALWAFGTLMSGWLVANLIKFLVHRARPAPPEPIDHALGYSFPSGHAASAALASTVLLLLLWPRLRQVGRAVACSVAGLFVLGTCLDRLFLGVHFPSDVIAGVVFGVGFAATSYLALAPRCGAPAQGDHKRVSRARTNE